MWPVKLQPVLTGNSGGSPAVQRVLLPAPVGRPLCPTSLSPWMAGCLSKCVTWGCAADPDPRALTTEAARLRVHQGRHFSLQRILSISIHLSKCTLNVHCLSLQPMNHLTVFLKTGKHSCALPYSLSITLGSDGLDTVGISEV